MVHRIGGIQAQNPALVRALKTLRGNPDYLGLHDGDTEWTAEELQAIIAKYTIDTRGQDHPSPQEVQQREQMTTVVRAFQKIFPNQTRLLPTLWSTPAPLSGAREPIPRHHLWTDKKLPSLFELLGVKQTGNVVEDTYSMLYRLDGIDRPGQKASLQTIQVALVYLMHSMGMNEYELPDIVFSEFSPAERLDGQKAGGAYGTDDFFGVGPKKIIMPKGVLNIDTVLHELGHHMDQTLRRINRSGKLHEEFVAEAFLVFAAHRLGMKRPPSELLNYSRFTNALENAYEQSGGDLSNYEPFILALEQGDPEFFIGRQSFNLNEIVNPEKMLWTND